MNVYYIMILFIKFIVIFINCFIVMCFIRFARIFCKIFRNIRLVFLVIVKLFMLVTKSIFGSQWYLVQDSLLKYLCMFLIISFFHEKGFTQTHIMIQFHMNFQAIFRTQIFMKNIVLSVLRVGLSMFLSKISSHMPNAFFLIWLWND